MAKKKTNLEFVEALEGPASDEITEDQVQRDARDVSRIRGLVVIEEEEGTPAADEKTVSSLRDETPISELVIADAPKTSPSFSSGALPLSRAIEKWSQENPGTGERLVEGQSAILWEKVESDNPFSQSVLDEYKQTIRWAVLCKTKDYELLEDLEKHFRAEPAVKFNGEIIGEIQNLHVLGDELVGDIFATPGSWFTLKEIFMEKSNFSIGFDGNFKKVGTESGEKFISANEISAPTLNASPKVIERILEKRGVE